jgi:gag-polyprotein putative aspartyl protease
VVEKLLEAKADINAAAASWGGCTAQRRSLWRKLVARFSQDEEGLSRSAVAQSEGINSNGDDLPAVQFLHAKRPKKKRGLPGFVNGVRVAAMADTGASVNVISEAYAQKMRLEIVESDASYRLGNSRSGRCIGKLCTAQAYRSYESR